MSAPERIWVEKSIAEKGNHGSTAWHNTDEPSDIEYVRADLCTPTDERVARLVNAVKAMPDDWCCDGDCDPCEELRAALRDMEGGE